MTPVADPTAEQAYLFRHAIVRDAAYDLQPATQRAELHQLVISIIEELLGGDERVLNAAALELAEHASRARVARQGVTRNLQMLKDLTGLESRYLKRAAEFAERSYRHGEALSCWKRRLEICEPADRPETLHRAGSLSFAVGRPEAEELLRQAIVASRESGDTRREGVATGGLGSLYRQTGRISEALEYYQRALELQRAAGDLHGEGVTLTNLANYYMNAGELESAESALRQVLDVYRREEHVRSKGIALNSLGCLYLGTDRMAEALETFEHATVALREVGDRFYEGVVLGNLAYLYDLKGDHERAEQAHRQASEIAREVADRRLEGVALGNLASCLREQGRVVEAAHIMELALGLHREMANVRFEGIHLLEFATILVLRGDIAAAREAWLQGTDILQRTNDRVNLPAKRPALEKACKAAGIEPF